MRYFALSLDSIMEIIVCIARRHLMSTGAYFVYLHAVAFYPQRHLKKCCLIFSIFFLLAYVLVCDWGEFCQTVDLLFIVLKQVQSRVGMLLRRS